MTKLLRIETCNMCRFFRPGFYDYCENCESGKLLIGVTRRGDIPDWCPLENAPDVAAIAAAE